MDTRSPIDQDLGGQGVVSAFKAFYASLSAQGEAIKALERSQDELANSLRNDISSAVQKKANAAEFSARMVELEGQLKKKADVLDMERRPLKADTDASLKMQMAEVLALLTSKANDADVKALKVSNEQSMAVLRTEMARLATGLEEAKAALSSKAGAADTAVALASKADLSIVHSQLREKVDRASLGEALATKVDAPSLAALEDDIRRQLAAVQHVMQLKAEVAMVKEGFQRLEAKADQNKAAAEEGMSNMSTALDRALEARSLEAQGELEELSGALRDELYSAVADVTEQQAVHLESKPDTRHVEQLIDERTSEAQEVTRKMAVEIAELRAQVARANQALAKAEALQQDMAEQRNLQHAIRATLEMKANVQDVNKALADVCREIESRNHGFNMAASAQRLSAQPPPSCTCSGAIIGRWLWKTGSTLAGQVLPWNIQAVNTAPDVLVWSPDSSIITCHLPGLWQLSFGFFSRTKPTVQVFVNGEPVIKSQSFQSTPLKEFPSMGESRHRKAMTNMQHSSGNVTGLTGSEFVSLPFGGARLAVSIGGVDSSERIEGFLQLQKL